MKKHARLFYSYEVSLDVTPTSPAFEPHYHHALQMLHISQLLPAFRAGQIIALMTTLVRVEKHICSNLRHEGFPEKQSFYAAKIGKNLLLTKYFTKILVKNIHFCK